MPYDSTKPFDPIIEEINKQSLWLKTIGLKRSDLLKTPGSKDTNLYFIRSGSLRIFVNDAGEEHTIRFGYSNELITALDCFISDGPSDLCIQALRKSKLDVISKVAFMNVIESNTMLKDVWIKTLGQLIYQQMERERDILTTSPYDRYQRVFQRSPGLFQEVPHKYIASYLRMTPETLSRIKKS